MSDLSYNNWLFNLNNKVKHCIYSQNLNTSRLRKTINQNFDEGKYFYFKKDNRRYPNSKCRFPILAIRRFITWIVFDESFSKPLLCQRCHFVN